MANYIAIYWARRTGNSVEEEMRRYEMRAIPANGNSFKISSYEKYLDQKSNFRLRGEW